MVYMKPALFWSFMKCRMVVSYQTFETTDWSHLQMSNSPRRILGSLFYMEWCVCVCGDRFWKNV